MANNNGSTQVPPNSTGNQIDCSSLSVGGVTAYRQRVVIADNTHSANFALVSSGSLQVLVENTVTVGGGVSLQPGTSKIGFLQKISASVTVQGNVGLNAGTQHIGEVNISLMPAVALAAGAANIGTINNISAAVGLAAGTQHVGEVNISLMPQVSVLNVAGTAHIGEVNISLMPAVVLAAGTANFGTLNNVSATVVVAGIIGIGAGIANIGTLNNISAAVTLAAGTNTIGAITVAGFIDPSGNQRNVVDSVNTALRVNVVAGGSGGGVVTGPVLPGASVTAGNAPVLFGGWDGAFARIIRTDSNGYVGVNVQSGTLTMSGKLDGISATVMVAGSLTIGGQTGNTSATVGSTYTLIGGSDGSIGRIIHTDANGNQIINNISATVVVAGIIGIGSGIANIGTINNISATVLVAGSLTIGGVVGGTSSTAGSSFTLIGGNDGSIARVALMDAAGHQIISGTVALAAGAANIGTINNISAGVVLAAGAANIGTINNISAAVVLAAGAANIGTINNISATVVVNNPALNATIVVGGTSSTAGNSMILVGGQFNGFASPLLVNGGVLTCYVQGCSLAAGTSNIGFINGISATVNVAGSLTIGGIAGGTSSSAASSFTLIGGNDGSIARVALMDAAGHQIISGTVALAAGAANIGTINNISAGVVLAAGAANVGTINNISAAVTVVGNIVGGTTSATAGSSFVLIGGTDGSLARVALMDAAGHQIISGTVALAAGAANIGSINNISAAVVLAAGSANIGSINNISANVNVVLQTGTNNIGTIQAISAAVGLAAGTQHIGEVNISLMPTVNVNIAAQSAGLTLRIGSRVKTSASSTVADSNTNPLWGDKNGRLIVQLNHPALPPSASHGPKTVVVSSSASVALLPAQGAGIQNYVDSLIVTNGSSTLTQWMAYEASATGTLLCAAYLAASGGGFTHYFNPPWRISANTILNMRIKPNASQVMVTIHFHVGVD